MFVLPVRQRLAPRVVAGQAGQLELHADELGTLRLPVLLEPVGVVQRHPVVVGAGADVGQERFLGSADECSLPILRASVTRNLPSAGSLAMGFPNRE
jgi:hypothetical protein